ncbi:MAG: glycosyltransferase family 2 protein [Pseudomonadota bacterium]
MDNTKQPLGVITNVYGDYFFLQRWYDYYAAQVGPENLYVYSHGNDPRHREIAQKANVIGVPRDPTLFKYNRRKWSMLSHLVAGLSHYYNWVILTDVDEIVIVDPDVSDGLVAHLKERYWDPETAPHNIAPLCLDMIHHPHLETDPITESDTILSKRRTFRPKRNYSKPCLVRSAANFMPGGHANDLGPRHLPDDLYLLHLKFFDVATITERGADKAERVLIDDDVSQNYAGMTSWYKPGEDHAKILERSVLAGENIRLGRFRRALRQQIDTGKNRYNWGSAKTRKLFRIPERFAEVF